MKNKLIICTIFSFLLTGCQEEQKHSMNANQSSISSNHSVETDAMNSEMETGFAPSASKAVLTSSTNPSLKTEKQHKWQILNHNISLSGSKEKIIEKIKLIENNCRNDCFIFNSTINNIDENNVNAYIELKIKSEKAIEFKNILSSGVELKNNSSIIEDQNQFIVDIEKQKALLLNQKSRMEEILESTKNTSEMIDINNRIAEIENQIEYLEGRFRKIENDVSMDIIRINLSTEIKQTEENIWEPLLSVVGEIPEKLIKSVAFFIMISIYVIPYFILAGIVVYLIRKYRKRTK